VIVTADTSVIVPSLLQWHERYERAVVALRDVSHIPAHALAESFSVLTRLPLSRALAPPLAEQVLLRAFPGQPLLLSSDGYRGVIRRLVQANLGGGRIYDAIVGATAAEAGARLITADRRAVATYVRMGVDFLLVD
jgi:toxin FitB